MWPSLAALAAVLLEVAYRAAPALPWHWWLPVSLPLILVINYGIWTLMVGSQSLIGGVVIFSILTATLRAVASWGLGEAPAWQDWLAFGLVLVAAGVQAQKGA